MAFDALRKPSTKPSSSHASEERQKQLPGSPPTTKNPDSTIPRYLRAQLGMPLFTEREKQEDPRSRLPRYLWGERDRASAPAPKLPTAASAAVVGGGLAPSLHALPGAAGVQRKCAMCEQEEEHAGVMQRNADGSGLAVRPADDGYEREADRVASTVVAGGYAPVQGRVGGGAGAQRDAGGAGGGFTAPSSVGEVLRSEGAPLNAGTRAFMETRMGHDFGNVRIHSDARADASTRAVNALAYTVGQDIAFRNGQYDPASERGRRLLAHELVHVCQQEGGSSNGERLQRQQAPSGVEHLPSSQVAPPTSEPAPLTSRLAAFQRLVKDAGKLRLAQNGRALEQWRQFLQQLTPAQVQTQVHAEEVRELLDVAARGGLAERSLVEQWLRTPGANSRWVLEQKSKGHFHACTGCHFTVQAEATDRALAEQGHRFRTPLEQLAIGADQGPRPTFASGEQVTTSGQPGVFPAVAQAQERINTLRPYLRALGPDGYRVLPPETLGSTAPPSELVADIGRRIAQRQADYREFSHRIDAADFDYLQLRPLVRDLLPLADADVRQAVLQAMDDAQTWETIESIVVGAASIGLLLLAIFPPTSAIGIGGALALGTAMGAHQVYRGYQNFEQGRLYSLGRGAADVLDPAQQEAADSLMAIGALNMVLGSVGVASGALGSVRLIRSLPPPGGGLGALEAVEGRTGGNLYRVTGWGTRDPRVVVTGPNGQVIQEGPLSSFQTNALGGTQASTRGANVTAGGYFYPTEGGAARVAQPVPVPEPVPAVVPQPIPPPAARPDVPVTPDVRGLLATMGGTSAVDVITASGAPGRQPVMPSGLSRADQELWRTCNRLHDTYKATQREAAAYSARMDPIEERLQNNRASAQDRVDYCLALDEQMRLVQRLHKERSRYMALDCDRFDWFNEGRTAAERLADHERELRNVTRNLNNLYKLRKDLCP
ncbi:MAG TPA: DUF4157 domain-containing protein [Archangium sp.]|nr:DUF4157 domain-containing protein [Archangium sp.]